jgi:hypothetical protein
VTGLAIDVLTSAITSAEELITQKRAEHAALAQEIERLEHELRLLRELRGIREGPAQQIPEDGTKLDESTRTVDGYDPLTAGVIEVLNASGRPMHIQDLATAVRERGLRIPGQGVNANLITHIRACEEIVRPVRGMYAMRRWGFADREPVASRRKRRRIDASRQGTSRAPQRRAKGEGSK